MRLKKVLLAALAAMAALGGWATAEAADRDDYYRNGYYAHPDRSYTYYYYPDRSYYYPDRSSTYYYYPDSNRYYGSPDPHRSYLNEHSYNRWDSYRNRRPRHQLMHDMRACEDSHGAVAASPDPRRAHPRTTGTTFCR